MSFTACTWPCNHSQEREEPYRSTTLWAVFTAVSAWTSVLFVGDQHCPCFLFICLISLSHVFILNVSLPLFLSVFILNTMNQNLIYNKVWQPFNGGIQSTHIYCNEWCIWFIISILLILNFWTLLWTLLLFTVAGMNEWLFIFPLCHLEFILLLIVMAQQWRICLQCRRRGFHLWVGKIPWRRKWQPTPGFLLGKSHGQRKLADYSPCGCKSVGHNLATKQQQ